LNSGVFVAVIIARGNDMAVKVAANLFAIFCDGCLGAHLHASICNDLNSVNRDYFFESHFDTPIKINFP
jgi:hypothetical protein